MGPTMEDMLAIVLISTIVTAAVGTVVGLFINLKIAAVAAAACIACSCALVPLGNRILESPITAAQYDDLARVARDDAGMAEMARSAMRDGKVTRGEFDAVGQAYKKVIDRRAKANLRAAVATRGPA